MMAAAQLVQPVKWTGEEIGDSVRLKAVIDPGFHMSIIEFGEREFDEEFADSFVITLAKTDLTPIRFNACDDKMCTAPEVWSYSEAVLQALAPVRFCAQSSSFESTKSKNKIMILLFTTAFVEALPTSSAPPRTL